MKSSDITIKITNGLHARPTSELITYAKKFSSHIEIKYKEKTANAKSLMSVLALCVPYGADITITAEGEDEKKAVDELTEMLKTLK